MIEQEYERLIKPESEFKFAFRWGLNSLSALCQWMSLISIIKAGFH